MRLALLQYLAGWVCVALLFQAPVEPDIARMRAVSYTFKVNNGAGSCVFITRDRKQYVWTAAHVVNGSSDYHITKPIFAGDKKVGSVDFSVELMHQSEEYDLALCRVIQSDLVGVNTEFYLDDNPPDVGTPVYHVGSILGENGALSFTSGRISLLNRQVGLWRQPKDQLDLSAAPGSSGGGVFLADGRCIGLLVGHPGAPVFSLITPVRQMKKFTETFHCKWALDPCEVPE